MQAKLESKLTLFAILLAVLGALPGNAPAQAQPARITQTTTAQQRRGARGEPARGVYKAQVVPHWFAKDTKFWYRNDLPGGNKEFILVDAEQGSRQPAFDHQKLANALSKTAGQDYKPTGLPFGEIEFTENGSAIQFKAASKTWKCNLTSYECIETKDGSGTGASNVPATTAPDSLSADVQLTGIDQVPGAESLLLSLNEDSSFAEEDSSPSPKGPQQQQQTGQRPDRNQRQGGGGQFARGRSLRSPDGKWTAFIKDQNVFLRSEGEGTEFQLSQDGATNNAYGRLDWSPDSKTFIGWRIEPGDNKEVYLVQSSPANGGRAILESRPYPQAGDKFTAYELSIFDVESRKQIKPPVDRVDFGSPAPRWHMDGRHFTYEKVDRGHQRFRVIEIDARNGTTRNLIDEQTKTFIWTAHAEDIENRGVKIVTYLDKTDEMINASERDGWRHLYLFDAKAGKLKNQMTKGEWVVRGVDKIDEEQHQVWFQASGMNLDQDPYFIHYYRINFDGTGLVALTEGNGNHSISYSPDHKYLIDTFSRVDMPPVNNLRRSSDGKLVCRLEEADITELEKTGWAPPEVFTAKGRDGKTDIWGIILRPKNFDPGKKYPILEDIYAGPQDSYVPKSFSGGNRYAALNELGFVVVKMDGMGTANRSKAFHDVCWQNLKDAGFPDRILWIKAAAAKYPAMDITRVGVYGTSAGGQNAAGAVLFHPEFYKAAVANCGCHDNRLDKASWNEQWMGYPVGQCYSECSNIDNAGKLEGHLFLIVGELDHNVPPESTFRFVDALIKAKKDFDFLVVTNGDHGSGGAYGQRRLQDFFQRYLLNVEPPNRNAIIAAGN